jgi:hypothetical protein
MFRRRLAETEEQLASGLTHIAHQTKLVIELETNGQPTDHARYLFAGLELLQAVRRDSRKWLLGQLNNNDDPS